VKWFILFFQVFLILNITTVYSCESDSSCDCCNEIENIWRTLEEIQLQIKNINATIIENITEYITVNKYYKTIEKFNSTDINNQLYVLEQNLTNLYEITNLITTNLKNLEKDILNTKLTLLEEITILKNIINNLKEDTSEIEILTIMVQNLTIENQMIKNETENLKTQLNKIENMLYDNILPELTNSTDNLIALIALLTAICSIIFSLWAFKRKPNISNFSISDLNKIDQDGSFSCPSCEFIITPSDETTHTIIDFSEKDGSIKKLKLQCKKCKNLIDLRLN
jgi:hypothetical protein